MKKKIHLKKFKDSFAARNFLFVIGGLLAVAAVVFIFLYNNFKEDFIIDLDGYMIGVEDLNDIKSEEVELKKLNIVKVKGNDSIYKNTFDTYVDSSKKKIVNVDLPLFANDGLAIVNYNENVNLLDSELNRSVGEKNLVLSYGKKYDSRDYTQVDKESYLFLSYMDDIYINLYDLKIDTVLNSYEIPTNSIIYFTEDRINYFERSNNKFIRKSIEDIDYDSKLLFYSSGQEEKFEYTYEELLVGIDLIFLEVEIPNFGDLNDGEQNTDIEKEEVIVKPDEGKNDATDTTKPEKHWEKPVVKSSELKANVYSLEGTIKISDPAGVIKKAPTYTMYVDNKVYSRRTFYGSGNIVIGGLTSETTYYIVGQYTYLDSDFKTQKIVTFYVGTITTKNRDSLEKIDLDYKLGEIYSKKIELNDVKITSDLNSEALRGVRKVVLKVNGDTYNLSTKRVQSLLNGNSIKVDTSESLPSNSDIKFELIFYDRENNILISTNSKGETRTCKKEPTVFLKLADTDTINVKISVDLRNDDNVELNNYRYVVTNTSGKVVATDFIKGDMISINDLDPNQIFTLKVLADIDIDNNKGLVEDYQLGIMELSTLPISSLGFVNLKVNVSDIKQNGATVNLQVNKGKTDAILLKILNKITVRLYEEETGELVASKYITGVDIEEFAAGVTQSIEFGDLDSNTKYIFEFKSLVKQGSTEYDLDCIYNLDNFETTKKPAVVMIANSFTSNNMIDFDCMVLDEDGAILSGEVYIELRDEKKNIVKTQFIDVNTEDYIRITYNNLQSYHNYTIIFYANEYNETNINSEYKAKYQLRTLDIFTEEGIGGKIELISSLRKATGTNIADLKSEIKWIESQHHYTIPKTIDEEGDMHIYSKNGASAYSYDLNDYTGKLVTASFKIKAVTPVDDKFKIYFSNHINGSTSANYGFELTNVGTSSWKSYTYTFMPGYYYDANKQAYVKNTTETYGRRQASFVGFYINGGNAKMAEYEIRDFKIQVVDSNIKEYPKEDFSVERGQYNGSGKKTNHNSYVRLTDGIKFQGGYYHTLNFDVKYVYLYLLNDDGTVYRTLGWYEDGVTIYVPANKTAMVMFRHLDPNEVVDPNEVNFRMTRFNRNDELGPYESFKYDLITKVRVNVVDLRNEITNRDYFIRVYEKDNLVDEYNYKELVGVDRITEIKEIALDEHKDYKVELGIKIRDRYYALSMFEISTTGEVQGIENLNDWYFIQPRGNYILLNDLSFKDYREERTSYGYRYFYGSIDFQGYTMSTYSIDGVNLLDKLYRIEKSAIVKNLVLDIHYQHTLAANSHTSFVYDNYGLIENVYVNLYDETTENLENVGLTTLVTNNQRTGIVRNFVVNIANKTSMYRNSSMLVYNNYGLIENGYIYGEDIEINPEYAADSNLGMIFTSGTARSTVNRVFVLPSLIFGGNSQVITGLIGEDTSGVVSNAYTIGSTNHNVLANGPGVGKVGTTATLDKVYYMNENIFNNSFHQKINATALNDIYFQESLFGEAFDVTDMIKLGYYPQVKFSSQKMPQQPYLELPKVLEDNLVDIVSMEILEQTNSSAVVEFNVSNPDGENITKISIADLDTAILEQEFSDGKSKVKVELTNPDVYVSKYQIRSISSVNYLGYSNTRNYDLGEKYADISFYREIKTVDDWKKIKDGLNQNYSVLNDLDMYGYTTDVYIGNFTGKIEGNNNTIKNITITKAGVNGLFSQMNGTLQNINFENFEHSVTGSYGGIVGYSNQYGRYNNVHVKNARVYTSDSKTSDTFMAGALVGNATSSRIQNCSATDSSVYSTKAINNVGVGGLVGYADAINITNSFVQNTDINVSNSISVYGIGGIVGRVTSANAYVSGCYATGNLLSNNTYNGGLIGYSAAVVERNYSAVNVTSDLDYTAGIIGFVSSNAANIKNNLYIGNLYSLKDTGKIAVGIEVDPSNYGLSSSLVNGVKSDINHGESVVNFEDLLINETYYEIIGLGEDFEYKDAEKTITPKLYFAGSDELIPGQKDNYLYKDMFEIHDIVIDKHAEYANIVIYLKNPDNLFVTDVDISDVEVNITKNANENGLAIIEIKAYPERFFDSYKLSKIFYKETEDGEIKTFDKNIKLDMIFYKYIKNYDDWQNISKEYAENYLLMADIDFSSRKDVNVGVLINRLETTGADEYHTLSGIELNVTKNVIGTNIIQKVISGMKNIVFDDIKVTDTSTSTNNYSNLIMYNYGELENLIFKNINIDSPKENYVSIIGANYGLKVNNINLDNVTINGREYVSGFIAYPYNREDIKYNNINAINMNITGERNYVGGVFGNMPNHHNFQTTTNVSIKDSNIKSTGAGFSYVGGISGVGDCNYCYVDNVEVTGARYVGGMTGYQRAYYDTGNKVVNSRVNVSEYYGGGMYGQSLYIYDSNVSDTIVTTLNASTYGAGGFSGYKTAYNHRSCGVTNVTVTGNGTEHGGLVGRMTGGSIASSYVQDSMVNGTSKIGGLVGTHLGGTISHSTATRSLVNATDSYAGGIVGLFGNTEGSHGALRQTYVTDIDVRANVFAGGITGGLKYPLINYSYIERLYFEGSVLATSGRGSGIGTGDAYNEEITRSFKMGYYEKATVNKDKLVSLVSNNISPYNMISDNPLVHGKYLDDSTGLEKTYYAYPTAAYTSQFIELEKGKTYQFGVNNKTGRDAYRILFYDKNGKFLRVLSEGTTNNYYINDMNTISTDKVIFTSLFDQKIKIYFYYFEDIEYYYLSEYYIGDTGIRTDQLMTYNDVRNRASWTRYLIDNTSDYYYYTKLMYDQNYFDFSPLNYNLPEFNMVDLSENQRPLKITASAVNKYGILMDGKYNYGLITGYTAGTEFTVNAKLMDISNSNPGYQFFFSSEDFDSTTQNGYGTYIGGRQVCARIRGGNYCSGLYLSRDVPMDVTISYNGVDTLKFYKNGELYTTTTLKRPLVILDTAKTMIAPPYKDGTNTRRYEGTISYLKVFNRTLSDEEVKNNYINLAITNTESLELYYDFTSLGYVSNDGYYPTVKDDYIMTTAEGQILTQLPDDNNRLYIKEANSGDSTVVANGSKVTDDKLDNIFNVYASSISTVNLEFDDNYKDLTFTYKNGDYSSEAVKVSNRVYTLNYDFTNDLEITLNSSSDSKTFNYKAKDLVRKIKIIGDNYYHITDDSLYENNEKILDDTLHIYNNLVLLKNGKLYNLNTKVETEFITQKGVLKNPVSIHSFDLDGTHVDTYYSFSEVTNSNGTSIREGQMMVREGTMFVFSYDKNIKNDMNVYDLYNTDTYQISLKDNTLISVMKEIKLPMYFTNSEIVEMSFDESKEEPELLIRYDNGYIYAFNYANGRELFKYGTEPEVSLFSFIANTFSNDTVLSASNDSYKDSNKLKKKLINIKDTEVKDKLNISSGNASEDKNINEGVSEPVENKFTEQKEITSNYIQVYNYDTNTYEVYNTNDLLNTTQEEVVSERIKIKSDAFLYNYFYNNKVNRLLDGSKIIIFIVVIVLVIVNLVIFIRYLNTKELKKRG